MSSDMVTIRAQIWKCLWTEIIIFLMCIYEICVHNLCYIYILQFDILLETALDMQCTVFVANADKILLFLLGNVSHNIIYLYIYKIIIKLSVCKT